MLQIRAPFLQPTPPESIVSNCQHITVQVPLADFWEFHYLDLKNPLLKE